MSETHRHNKRDSLQALMIGCLLSIISSALVGCGPHPVAAPNPRFLGKSVTIHYFNSPLVDVQIRSFLYHSVDTLTVRTHDIFDLDELPATMLEWIRRCVSAKGEISLERYYDYRARGTRGAPTIPTDIESGIAYFWDRYQEWKKDRWYKPISNYNIKIVYKDKDKAERGNVNRIIFERKNPISGPQAGDQRPLGGIRSEVQPSSSPLPRREQRPSSSARREQRSRPNSEPDSEPRSEPRRDQRPRHDAQPERDQEPILRLPRRGQQPPSTPQWDEQ